MSEPPPSQVRILESILGVGATLAAFAACGVGEYLYIAVFCKGLLAGGWETAAIRTDVFPLLFGLFVPVAVAMRLLGGLAARAGRGNPVARRLLAASAMAGAAAVAWGISGGRHFASAPIRTAFVLVLSVVAAAAVFVIVPVAARASARARVAAGVGLAICAWASDAFVLPHLYPSFHAALFFVTLGGAAIASGAMAVDRRGGRAVALLFLLVAGVSLAFARRAATRLTAYDNLRMVLIERAPILGRGVRFAASLSPPVADGDGHDPISLVPAAPGAVSDALDFRARDILFITIDALRADHVGAYGYARATTPNLDRLAQSGVRFEAAYCPTPHTSYSVTSMMTGKYMRPLLALDLGEDSDTWAGLLRHYGYRTAAFYPPAVFFIDEARFGSFRDRGLDFEYRKVEFADPALRERQIDEYLTAASREAEQPLFLWVHLFEPHEPYVMHAQHPFGDPAAPKPIDAYDSEIATADEALGAIVARVRQSRPHVVTVVAADHGEEFGEHGGRYHGTSVYEEQVRVPMVMVAEGLAPRVVTAPVQTIDLLPTVLDALRIPRPARIRGRDLAPLVTGAEEAARDPGFAFAETDDLTMVAEGPYRLICERRIGACSLFEPRTDPRESHDLGREHPEIVTRLRARAAELSRSHGRFERGSSAEYPEALRRALQGDAEAALEVAPLLDDVRIDLRRAAARALYELHVESTAPFAERALLHEPDPEVSRWAALALIRMRSPASREKARALAETLLRQGEPDWKARAALAFAEAGDGRGVAILAARLESTLGKGELSFAEERAIVQVLGALRDKSAVPALLAALHDVRLRPLAVSALAAIGDATPHVREALLRAFESERYVTMRGGEARAILALSPTPAARASLEPALRRFAGVPEAWPDAARIAEAARLLDHPAGNGSISLAPSQAARRVYVVVDGPDGGTVSAKLRLNDREQQPSLIDGNVAVFELDEAAPPSGAVESSGSVAGVWVVTRAAELPPPPPVRWSADGGAPLPEAGAGVDRAAPRQ